MPAMALPSATAVVLAVLEQITAEQLAYLGVVIDDQMCLALHACIYNAWRKNWNKMYRNVSIMPFVALRYKTAPR